MTVIDERFVWVSRAPARDYRRVAEAFPELPGFEPTSAAVALRTVLLEAGLDRARAGTSAWNPLSAAIQPGMNVVIKPNRVAHQNAGSDGWECLITHPSLLEALARYVLKAHPARLTIGDAPVQGCDFPALMTATGTGAALARLPAGATEVAIADFRLVSLEAGPAGAARQSATRTPADYVAFDLGPESLLEPITTGEAPFRVTMYDPRALAETHAPGRHQYLVAREVVDADLVVNVPKLKTHKKAGITGALKNLVGINGHKSYLPHHRKGGSHDGGDCYAGRSVLKARAEDALDAANRLDGGHLKALLYRSAEVLERAGTSGDDVGGLEGSWHGNDTVWRMSLDLQRLLRYGRPDGRLADAPQRSILSVTDAIVAGQGEGPLAPAPCPLGLVTFAANAAAAEWVHAELMGFDPRRIPIVAHAFDAFRYPLAAFAPDAIAVGVGGARLTPADAGRTLGARLVAPRGWQGACERPVEV
jgi:uncharacterized protein (DUF362 family)